MDIYPALENRTAVVTGAASGMGTATARLLARSGARVALVSRRRDVLEELAADIGAVAVPADLADPHSVSAAAQRVHDALGRADLVVSAAGVMLPNPIAEARTDEWDRMIQTNLEGPLRLVAAFTDDLVSAAEDGESADLVTVSSVAAHLPMPEYAVYNATKAALTHLAASLRPELGPKGVRVTNIEPGLTRTELGSHIDNDAHATQLSALLDVHEPLEADDVADLIGYVTSRPIRVNLRQGILVPTRMG